MPLQNSSPSRKRGSYGRERRRSSDEHPNNLKEHAITLKAFQRLKKIDYFEVDEPGKSTRLTFRVGSRVAMYPTGAPRGNDNNDDDNDGLESMDEGSEDDEDDDDAGSHMFGSITEEYRGEFYDAQNHRISVRASNLYHALISDIRRGSNDELYVNLRWFYRKADFSGWHSKTRSSTEVDYVKKLSEAEFVLSNHYTINEAGRIMGPSPLIMFSVTALDLPPLSHNDIWSRMNADVVLAKQLYSIHVDKICYKDCRRGRRYNPSQDAIRWCSHRRCGCWYHVTCLDTFHGPIQKTSYPRELVYAYTEDAALGKFPLFQKALASPIQRAPPSIWTTERGVHPFSFEKLIQTVREMCRNGGQTFVPQVVENKQGEWIIGHMGIASPEDAALEGANRLKQFKGLPIPQYYTCSQCGSIV